MNNQQFSENIYLDQQLWSDVRNSDEKAFAMLFDKYHRVLFNYGCKLHTDTNLVEDAVQEVFIDLWRLRSNLVVEIQSVKFYLYRAMRRRIQGLKERYGRLDELDNIHENIILVKEDSASLIESESAELLSKRIQALIANLPPRQMEVLTLRYFDDFSVPEIAALMDINEKSVRNLLFKAITSLRDNKDWLIISFILPFLFFSLLMKVF